MNRAERCAIHASEHLAIGEWAEAQDILNEGLRHIQNGHDLYRLLLVASPYPYHFDLASTDETDDVDHEDVYVEECEYEGKLSVVFVGEDGSRKQLCAPEELHKLVTFVRTE